jgi:hypothetical protein
MNFIEFAQTLNDHLSPLVRDDRVVIVRFSSSKGFTARPLQSQVFINFINLPEARYRQERGGGAENENNRMMFAISGFDTEETTPVAKVKIEHSVSSFPRKYSLRGKTASPEKIAVYLADFVNNVAAENAPNLTHE